MKNNFSVFVAGVLLIGTSIFAMPPLDGNWEPDYPPGVNIPDHRALSRDDADLEGEWRCLVILVDFEDYPWDYQEDENFPNEGRIYTQDHFNSMLFSTEEYQHPGSENDFTGSMRDYYLEISGGVFETVGVITRWYRAPQPLSYYCNHDGEEDTDDDYGFGEYPHNVQKLVEDVLELADEDVDFSEYDNEDIGVLDGLFIVHAGPGAEAQERNPNYIWSHKWQIAMQERDGVLIFTYSMEPQDGTIGVFCHEYGHVLGIPDLYDTDYSSQGIGDWGLMSGGSWGHRAGDPPGSSPVHMCAWSKLRLEWVELINITERTEDVEIAPVEDGNPVYRLWTEGDLESDEYFLLENRRRIGFDASLTTRQIRGELPAPEGLLITHIDDDIGRNNDELHRLVDIEEASPIYINDRPLENLDGNLEDRGEYNLYNPHRGDDGDLWPGFSEHNEDSTEWTGDRDHDRFGSFTIPSSCNYNDRPSLVEVYDIRSDGDNVVCSFSVDAGNEPFPCLSEYRISDAEGGNDNGILEPGETFELWITVENVGRATARGFMAALEYDGDLVSIETDFIGIGDIPPGETVQPQNPFIVNISEDAPIQARLDFLLTIFDEDDHIFPYHINLEMRPPHEWFKHPDNPVLAGSNGEWNEDGVRYPAVVVEDDTLKCWFVGSAYRADPPVLGSVGYAWSIDGGINWTQWNEPVLTPDQDLEWMWEIISVGVMSFGRGYLMAILAVDRARIAYVGIAASEDGSDWNMAEEPILIGGDGWTSELYSAGQVSIFLFGQMIGVAFTGFDDRDQIGIGFALSADLVNWTINNDLILRPTQNRSDFDSRYVYSPDVTFRVQDVRILYSGYSEDTVSRLGVAYTDGVNLTRYGGLETGGAVLEPDEGTWDENALITRILC